MIRTLIVVCCLAILVLCLVFAAPAVAQDPPANVVTVPARRSLAPGVLTVIPTNQLEAETFTGPLPIVELVTLPGLDWTPKQSPKTITLLEKARKVILRRDIWNLEFSFKPLRMVPVDVPQPTGVFERKNIWYMVYRVRYVGNELTPAPQQDPFQHTTFPGTTPVSRQSRRFFPKFILESLDSDLGKKKAYMDRIIPAALEPISRREKVNQRLYNTVEITRIPIQVSDAENDRGVWGVATWEDIDPRIDFFSVMVSGLTNAYQFQDPPGAYKAGDPPTTGRILRYKTLQMNFWRPGDSVFEHEREIRYGIPIREDAREQADILTQYGLGLRLDHLWIYR
ncbi:MAG: hypothetical protein QGG36_22005 [Pirellulaceae bacterium]|jgi:hypothetical protein|nr:hypothetical protein [Pirellulaceae bacterium]MDP7018495.1 hypothetical protein [Pirellulaceae bacterium]